MRKIADSKTMLINRIDYDSGQIFQVWTIHKDNPDTNQLLQSKIIAYAHTPENHPHTEITEFDNVTELIDAYFWTDDALAAIIDPQIKDVLREEYPDLYSRMTGEKPEQDNYSDPAWQVSDQHEHQDGINDDPPDSHNIKI